MTQDAYSVIKHETSDSTIVIGFSDGAVIAMTLTIAHPELVRKMIFAGGNVSLEDYRPGVWADLKNLTGKSIERDYPDFVKDRKKMMPQPDRWNDFVEKLKHAWLNQTKIEPAQLKTVKCPVLVVGGDRDQYNAPDNFLSVYKSLPNAALAIIPNSDHIVFYRRPDLMEDIVIPFVKE
jgi:pimeloyl-ACP methyl ester carboxylesterase